MFSWLFGFPFAALSEPLQARWRVFFNFWLALHLGIIVGDLIWVALIVLTRSSP